MSKQVAKHIAKLKEVSKKATPGRKRPMPKEILKGDYEILDIDHYKEFFSEFSHQLKPGDILIFSGDLGAGKTEAIRSIVERLGGRWVSSPSFAIHQRYAVRSGFLDHVDLYRLEDDSDLESTGFWDLFDSKDSILAVEWGNRLSNDVWPNSRRRWNIKIKVSGTSGRKVTIG